MRRSEIAVKAEAYAGRGVRRGWLLSATFAGLAAGLVLLATGPNGTGVESDAADYLDAAHHIATGQGARTFIWSPGGAPLTHFPPGYPVLLSLAIRIGWDPIRFAFYLNPFFFAATVFSVGVVLTGRRVPAPLTALILAVTAISPSLLAVHSSVSSEPLFLLLVFGSLVLLADGLSGRRGSRAAIVSGLLAGFAVLTRYAGLALIGSAVLAVFLLSNGPWRRRMRAGLGFAVPALVLPGLWFLRNLIASGAAANRQLVWHPLPLRDLRRGLASGLDPLMPGGMPVMLGWIVGVALLVWFATIGYRSLRRHRADPSADPLPAVFAIFVAGYAVFLGASTSIADAMIPLDGRILSPMLLVILPLTGIGLARQLEQGASSVARAAVVVYGLLLIGTTVPTTGALVGRGRESGFAFAAKRWRRSGLVAAARGLAVTTPVYTSAPDAVWLLLGRYANELPNLWSPHTLLPNPNLTVELKALCRALRGGAVLTEFALPRPYVISADSVGRLLPLRSTYVGPEGRILAWDWSRAAPSVC